MDSERGDETPLGALSVHLELMFAPDSVDDESTELEDDPKKEIVLDSDDDRTETEGRNRLTRFRNERNGELSNSCLIVRKQSRAGYLWRNSQKVRRESACPPNTGAENESMIGFGRQELNQENNTQKQNEGSSNYTEENAMETVVKELLSRDEPDGCRLPSTISETIDRGKDISLVTPVHESRRLSYIDSQEPEEISLSDSLSFVDQYLSLNNFNMCDTDRDSAREPKKIIYPPILKTEGLQCLSRRVSIKRAEESGTFDWVEQPQNKESFSLKERCRLRQECHKSETGTINPDAGYSCPKLLDVCSDENISEQAVSVASQGVKSDSVDANCLKELVGDVNIISPNVELGKIEDETDGEPFLSGVGFDTQLAAEAMEALLHDPPNSNACYTHKIPSGSIIDQSSEVAVMSKKTENGTAAATVQHLKGKRSAKKLYENEGCLSGECDPYLRGHSCSSAPKKKLKENRLSGYINLDDEKLQVRRTSCRSKAQQRKRSPEIIQGRTSPKSLRPNYCAGLFERKTLSFSIIPKRRRSKPLRSLNHFPYPTEQFKDTSNHGMESNFSKKRSKANDSITDVNDKCKSKENCSNLASGASLRDEDSSRVIKLNCWSHPKKKRTPANFIRHSDKPKHHPLKIFNERPKLIPAENFKSTQRLACNLIVYTRRTKSESVSKGSCTIAEHDTSEKSSYFHTSESPNETGFNSPPNHVREHCIGQRITFDDVIDTVRNSERVKFDQGCKIASFELNVLKKCDERNIKVKKKPVSPIIKELRRLGSNERQLDFKPRNSRRFISSATVSVLFSQNLSSKTTGQLKKILARLGFSEVSSCSAATHFIADKFVRTKNMLEAIAFGKLVVTPSWLESCGQAGSLVAERSYILRDAKKEKEFGSSMPVSLARASQGSLLHGQRVLITPNVKPNKDLIQTLVKAVQGQEVDDFQLKETKDSAVSPDLLIISCEEDYGYCEPFLERGVAIYSSELLLNGIIIQKLQYERHRILMNYHTTMSSEKGNKGSLKDAEKSIRRISVYKRLQKPPRAMPPSDGSL